MTETNRTDMSPSELPTALDAIFGVANRSDKPGLVVAVGQHGKAVYRRGFGLASIEHGVANTPKTRMRIASISKQFTCFGALLLADEGKLDLDAPAQTLLPELPELEGYPTLRQFMHHASGLHDAADLEFMARGLAPWPDGLALLSAQRQTGVNFSPGHGQLYCNTGYNLLAIAIERATGKSFGRFMKSRVFEPLGMIDTELLPSDMTIVPNLATMHQALPDGTFRRGMTPGDDILGAGAAISTVDDLLRWLTHLRAPARPIGSAAMWNAMTQGTTLANGYVTQYAAGIMVGRYRGVETWQHGGSLIGVSTQLITVPAYGLDIAILSNCELYNPVELSCQVIDTMLAGEGLTPKPTYTGSDRFKHLCGSRWHAKPGWLIGFDDVGGKLGLSIFNSPFIPMLEEHGDELRLGGAGGGPFTFKVEELLVNDPPPQQLRMNDAGFPFLFARLASEPPDTLTAGKALIGRFRAADLDADARVEMEADGTLALHIDTSQGARSHMLQPLGDRVLAAFVRDPLYPARYVITVDPDGQGGRGPSFQMDGGRSRNVRFERVG